MYKHRFDPISFVFGLVFAALAVGFVVPDDPWDIYFGGIDLGWLWPLVVIAAGIALLVPLFRVNGEHPTDPEPTELTAEEQAEALEELGEPPV